MKRAMIYVFETRPQFIILSVACVLVGAGAAYWKAGGINPYYLVIAMIGAISAHASVNILNDYCDYKSGLDEMTIKTPFSGGSGILPGQKMSPRAALYYGLATLSIAIILGFYLVFARGWQILLVGVPGLLLIVLYTRYITRSPLLCLLAPGLGFGPCMVLGTYFALQGFYDITSVAVSLIPLFFVSNLLLLNQFPDTEADRAAGRRHLLTLVAPRESTYIYSILNFAAFLVLIISVYLKLLPLLTLVALICLPLALNTIGGVIKNHADIKSLIPYLGKNVILILSTLFLVAIGLFVS